MASTLIIDVASLEKGDWISPEIIEAQTGETVGTTAFQFAALKLKGEIEAALKAVGRPATLKQEGAGIRLLSDSEAAVYNEVRGERACAQLAKAHRRNLAVDETNLPSGERQTHYRVLDRQSRYLQALRNVRRQMRATPVQRQTPDH